MAIFQLTDVLSVNSEQLFSDIFTISIRDDSAYQINKFLLNFVFEILIFRDGISQQAKACPDIILHIKNYDGG